MNTVSVKCEVGDVIDTVRPVREWVVLEIRLTTLLAASTPYFHRCEYEYPATDWRVVRKATEEERRAVGLKSQEPAQTESWVAFARRR